MPIKNLGYVNINVMRNSGGGKFNFNKNLLNQGENMTKRKKPFIIRLLNKILIFILILAIILGGVYAFVRIKYKIDLISTVRQIKVLSKDVNEDELCANKFGEADYESAKIKVNACVGASLITGGGTEKYKLADSFTGIFSTDVQFTDKECGALLDLLADDIGKISISGKDLQLELKQIKFNEYNEETKTLEFSCVIMIDVTPVKQDMTGFPAKWLKKYVPDSLYISATGCIIKGENPFEYTTKANGLTLNNLNKKDTEELLTTLNKVSKFGSANSISQDMINALADGLIGKEGNKGFAYSLKEIGANDFAFEKVTMGDTTTIHYVINN